MSELNNGWRQCPLGELDRLESVLKSQRQTQAWGYTLAVFALTGIIAFCSWQVASALLPGLHSGASHGASSSSPCQPPSLQPCDVEPGKSCTPSAI